MERGEIDMEKNREKNAVLLDCPFCGHKANIQRDYQGDGNTVVWCSNCYCQTAPYPKPSGSYNAWNSRQDR